MASAEAVTSIPRGDRGALEIRARRTARGEAYVELEHVGVDGQPGRGSTLKVSELPAVIAALRALHVREVTKQRPPVQQSLPPGGPDAQTRREMDLF